MNLFITAIVILSVTISSLCSTGLSTHGNSLEMLCRFGNLQPSPSNPNSCPLGSHENLCKMTVCYKEAGEICGNQRELDQQLRYGKCGKQLICCYGVCMKWGDRCVMPRELHTDFYDFFRNDKRHNNNNDRNGQSDRFDYVEY